MRRLAVLVFATLLVSPALARAQDEERSLSFNPFEDAKVGDWETCAYQRTSKTKPLLTAISTWRVKKVTDDEVTVDLETFHPDQPARPPLTRKYPRKGALKLKDYFPTRPGEKISGFASEKKKLTIDGHTFDGELLTFDSKGGFADGKTAVFVASEVKGFGLVGLEVALPDGSHQEHRIVGFGTAEKKLWGKTADELETVPNVPGEKPSAANLYQDRVHGFSIRPPAFREVQDQQVAQTFTLQGRRGGLSVLVRGVAVDRKAFAATAKDEIAKGGFKLVKEEERRVSGKDALLLEYEGPFDIAGEKQDGRILDSILFLRAHVVSVRGSALAKDFAKVEKKLRASLDGTKLIDVGMVEVHKGEEPGVYYDHPYGLRVPLPELAKPRAGELFPVVQFQGPMEANSNTSLVSISVSASAVKREDYKPSSALGLAVGAKRELEVSGKPALEFDSRGEVNGRPVLGRTLVVFDDERTIVVEATGAKAAWDEERDAFRDSLTSFRLAS